MKRLIISSVTLLALYMGYANTSGKEFIQHSQKEIMEKQDKKEIEKLLKAYKEVLNTSDANGAISLYTKDGVFMPSNAPSAIGSENIRGAYEFVFSQIQLNIEFYIEEIVVDHNFAYALTTSKGTTLIRATNETVPEENRELFVFEKENGDWKIARYMFNKMAPITQPEEKIAK